MDGRGRRWTAALVAVATVGCAFVVLFVDTGTAAGAIGIVAIPRDLGGGTGSPGAFSVTFAARRWRRSTLDGNIPSRLLYRISGHLHRLVGRDRRRPMLARAGGR
jgi:hypothetical protein